MNNEELLEIIQNLENDKEDLEIRLQQAIVERDDLAKAAAEMRKALESTLEAFNDRYDGAPDSRMQWMGCLMRDIEHALSTDAGSDYVSKDDVKPLVDNIEIIRQFAPCIERDILYQKCVALLAHAKEKGLL